MDSVAVPLLQPRYALPHPPYSPTPMDFLSLRRASVGARLAMLSCALVAVIFAAFTWAVTRSAGEQISEQVLTRIAEKDRSIAATITLSGKRHITQYKPVTDASGRVIGALFVGVDVGAQIKSVEDGIRQLKIGDSGYYFVLNASNGPDRGKFIVHPAAAKQLADDANAPYKQMLEAKEGQLAYTSADSTLGETGARDKYVSFITVPEWQWLVGGIAPRDEVMAEVVSTRNRFLLIGLV